MNGSTYKMNPLPFTKLNSVTSNPKNESLAVNNDLLYIVSKGFLYKHSISNDYLISSHKIDYRKEPTSFNDTNGIYVTRDPL
jgi:hypothetical protein